MSARYRPAPGRAGQGPRTGKEAPTPPAKEKTKKKGKAK